MPEQQPHEEQTMRETHAKDKNAVEGASVDHELHTTELGDSYPLKEVDGHLTDEDDDDDEEYENPLAPFEEVLASMSQDMIPHLALAIRQNLDPDTGHTECPEVGKPAHGSFNILFPLDFEDGIRWMIKFPINGAKGKWDGMAAKSLTTEANTMRLLKKETTIPLPEVFDFSSTTDNILGCPYILMSHIPGISLYDVWFGQHLRGVDPETLRAHRTRALDGIAAAMAQLERYSFNSSGSVRFDPDGRPTGLGSNRVLDSQAMIDRWWIRKDPCEDLLYVEQPPTTDVGAFYTFTMDHRELSPSYGKGAELLLRQMISWIPEPASLKPFVLAHPDFNFNNFIVSEDGQLMGVIDWDGVSAMPRSIGNESYPSWLTRDWDPMMYAYNESMDAGVEPLGVWEDSPDTLKHYRSVYCQLMAKACGEGSHSQEITRRSLIADNLIIAADDSQVRLNILVKIAGESFGDPDDEGFFRSMDLIHGLADDEIDELEMAKLKEGFMRLLDEAL